MLFRLNFQFFKSILPYKNCIIYMTSFTSQTHIRTHSPVHTYTHPFPFPLHTSHHAHTSHLSHVLLEILELLIFCAHTRMPLYIGVFIYIIRVSNCNCHTPSHFHSHCSHPHMFSHWVMSNSNLNLFYHHIYFCYSTTLEESTGGT